MELEPQQIAEAEELAVGVAEEETDSNELLDQIAETTERSAGQYVPDEVIERVRPSKLKLLLENRPDLFSFFQVMRLFRSGHFVDAAGVPLKVRIKPALSLSFQKGQIEKITFPADDAAFKYVEVITNLPGLYGTGSPLPTFYTEELIEQDVDDKRTVKDVFDVLNQRLYDLLHKGRNKYRLMERGLEDGDDQYVNYLFGLVGLNEKALKPLFSEPRRLIRYLGFFALKNRPAAGLQAMLSDLLGGLPVRVIQAVEHTGRIPQDQRGLLGSTMCLGEHANIGQEFCSSNGTITIEVGPVEQQDYSRFFPGRDDYNRIVSLTKLYLSSPIRCNLEIILGEKTKLYGVELGGELGGRIGLETWLGDGGAPAGTTEKRIKFSLS